MEPTGHYYENLARHIQQTGQKVTIVNSFAVKENRRQQMMAHEKDDEIDVAAIGDLLRRGKALPSDRRRAFTCSCSSWTAPVWANSKSRPSTKIGLSAIWTAFSLV